MSLRKCKSIKVLEIIINSINIYLEITLKILATVNNVHVCLLFGIHFKTVFGRLRGISC